VRWRCFLSIAWSAGPLGALTLCVVGCGRTPTPLNPAYAGSIGNPNRGVLTASAELPREGNGFKWLRPDDHHHGLPRFVQAIERAAAKVAHDRPGAMLSVGDISALNGGRLMPHLSHRNGRDADLLFYWTTLEGAPVETPGWIHVQADGLAWDEEGKRFLRFDVEREWLLVKTLLEDPDARVQWVFANAKVEAILIEWARARGDSNETIAHAMDVMLEPHPGGAHDDHIHVRTQCTAEEIGYGCEPTGPPRDWLVKLDQPIQPTADDELARLLFHPFSKP
jgi:penicillin-insensitive murein endopeptidase